MTTRERTLATLTGLIAGGVIIYWAATAWFLPQWADVKDDIQKAKANLELKPDKERKVKELEAQYAAGQGRALRFDTTQDAERMLSRQLFALASKAGMPTPNVSPRPPRAAKNPDDFAVINVSFNVRCGLQPIVQFLSDFYSETQAQRIESITLTPPAKYDSTEAGAIPVQMGISAVVMPPEAEKTAAANKKPSTAS